MDGNVSSCFEYGGHLFLNANEVVHKMDAPDHHFNPSWPCVYPCATYNILRFWSRLLTNSEVPFLMWASYSSSIDVCNVCHCSGHLSPHLGLPHMGGILWQAVLPGHLIGLFLLGSCACGARLREAGSRTFDCTRVSSQADQYFPLWTP